MTRWFLSLMLTLPFLSTGCIPAAWLPDSSGFLYTDGPDFSRLNHYDVVTGKHRVLVPQMPAQTPAPAISPDGKQVAVARLSADADRSRPESIQVILYNLAGQELQRSTEFPWAKERSERNKTTEFPRTAVYWAPTGGRLLIQDYEEPGSSSKTGVYDLQAKTLRVLDGWPLVFGGTPFCPNGKGFLLARSQELRLSVFLVSWDGQEQPIAIPKEMLDSEDKQSVLLFPWSGTSAWERNGPVVTYGEIRLRIDVDQRLGSLEKVIPAEAMVDGKKVLQRYQFPEGGLSLRVLLAESEQDGQRSASLHLELLKTGEAKPKELHVLHQGRFQLSPSPNGQWVVIRMLKEVQPKQAETLLLVNHRGEVREVTGNP